MQSRNRTTRLSKRTATSLISAAGIFVCAHAAHAGETIPREALERLQAAAEASHSDAVVVIHKGTEILAWPAAREPEPIETMSVTKSIANLVIGRLVTTGAIQSIDVPVASFYPEWRQGKKKDITIRHLLAHTSGLQNHPRADMEIYPAPDVVQLALCAELDADPGTKFAYNNKAVNLLAGIVKTATGKPMDEVFAEQLAKPLGIENFEWMKDQAGNPMSMAGLRLLPRDLAKLGQLVLYRGMWQGDRIIDESWFDESLSPGSEHLERCGLLWWLIHDKVTVTIDDAKLTELGKAGVPADFIVKIAAAKGTYDSNEAYFAKMREVLGPGGPSMIQQALDGKDVTLADKTYGKVIGYRAEGYLGQYIIILPEHELVAVRMIANSPKYNPQTDGFMDFERLVRDLVPRN